MNSSGSFLHLPNELKVNILKYLDTYSIISLLQIPQLPIHHLFVLITVKQKHSRYSRIPRHLFQHIDISDHASISNLQKIMIPLIEISTDDLKRYEQTVLKLIQHDNVILVVSGSKSRPGSYSTSFDEEDPEVQRILSSLMKSHIRHFVLVNMEILTLESVPLDPFYHKFENFDWLSLCDCSLSEPSSLVHNSFEMTNIDNLVLENPSEELIASLDFNVLPGSRLMINYTDPSNATRVHKYLTIGKPKYFEIPFDLDQFENISFPNLEQIRLTYSGSSTQPTFKNIFAPQLTHLFLKCDGSPFEITNVKTNGNLKVVEIITNGEPTGDISHPSDYSFINESPQLEELRVSDSYMKWTGKFSNLKVLGLQILGRSISSELESLQLNALTTLDLILGDSCITCPILKAPNLKGLNIRIGPWTKITDFGDAYKNLQTFSLRANAWHAMEENPKHLTLPVDLSRLSNLRRMALTVVDVNSIIGRLDHLEELFLIQCFNIPPHIDYTFPLITPSLKVLDITSYDLRTGRFSLKDLPHLTKLTISGENTLELRNVQNLEELDCSGTDMEEIRADHLPNLKKLFYESSRRREDVEIIDFGNNQSVGRIDAIDRNIDRNIARNFDGYHVNYGDNHEYFGALSYYDRLSIG